MSSATTGTGNTESLKPGGRKDVSLLETHGGSLFSGETHILHWEDVTSEISFVVPTRKSGINTKALWNVTGGNLAGKLAFSLIFSKFM